jgi:recombination protein RecR
MSSRDISRLVNIIGRLPGMGERSAARIVVHLLKQKHTVMESLIGSLSDIYKRSIKCNVCNNVDTSSPCNICSNPRRDKSLLCVVASMSDLWSIERVGFYKGVYHIINGKLSAINGISPDNIGIDKLNQRICEENICEVIIAMSADIDGQTTMFFIKDNIKNPSVKVTTLSHGMPVGGELDYLDDGTIVTAFSERKHV